jgi:hypothetical protein
VVAAWQWQVAHGVDVTCLNGASVGQGRTDYVYVRNEEGDVCQPREALALGVVSALLTELCDCGCGALQYLWQDPHPDPV